MNSADPVFGPLQFITDNLAGCALATIIRTEGPSYRSAGSVMAIAQDGRVSGSLSSGCIEADIGIQAMQALQTNRPVTIKYGQGSPFLDLRLPCGGAIEVLIVPRPDRQVIKDALAAVQSRNPQTLHINKSNGSMILKMPFAKSISNDYFCLNLQPGIAFHVFGSGAEAEHFAMLAASLQFDTHIYTPELRLVKKLDAIGIRSRLLKSPDAILPLHLDRWTAAVLFFHDHDWEPPILQKMLDTDAFYIGAQGSHLARVERDRALAGMGVSDAKIARIAGPIGLIPSTRDPRILAVSVMAEILALAQNNTH